MTVGYIGLGEMGAAMAGRLCDVGVDLMVNDLSQEAVDGLVAKGASSAATAALIAAKSRVVSTCVPAAVHLDAVVDGADGVFAGAIEDTTLLVHSTVHPDTIRSLAERGASHGVAVFDVCVAGGASAAADGELVLFVGGLDEMPDAARELLGSYGSKTVDAGPVGSGAALKIANNVMTYAQFSAAGAAYDLVRAAGGDTGSLLEAWRHTGQLGALTEQFFSSLSFGADDIVGPLRDYFLNTVGIAQKDLQLAVELGVDPPHGQDALVRALRDSMPALFGVDDG